jgi:hypothetical protein
VQMSLDQCGHQCNVGLGGESSATEQAQSGVCRSLGRCMLSASGQTVVRWVVVGWTRLWGNSVGSGAACHNVVCDNSPTQPHLQTCSGKAPRSQDRQGMD